MRILLLLFFAVLFGGEGVGQNLVPNPSFEDTVSCPISLADLSKTLFWTSPTQWASPDYFHTCSNSFAHVPNNIFGTQSPLTGNAYSGIAVYDTFDIYSYKEYIQTELVQTLISGQKYWVSFYVNLADSTKYAIQELGAYFSPIQINESTVDTTLLFIPQIEFSDSVITSKNNWIKIVGSFTAVGNENYLLIGNFHRKQTTTVSSVNCSNCTGIEYSYYFIDDVCVSMDSLTCASPLSVNEIEITNSLFSIYPNPINDYLIIENEFLNHPYNLTIYNAIGQTILEENNISNTNRIINTSLFNRGLLIINIKVQNQNIYYKFLKQ